MPASGDKPPVARINAGQILHRMHQPPYGARYFGNRDATWRWDDPDCNYGVMYLGRTEIGPFAETLLRTPSDRDVLWDRVEKKRFASFALTRTVRLAKLHGPGLAWFRTTIADVAAHFDPATHPYGYDTPQRISAWVHKNTGLDGIEYLSRFDTDHRCVALFDRAGDALKDRTSDESVDRAWARKVLSARGYNLIPPL